MCSEDKAWGLNVLNHYNLLMVRELNTYLLGFCLQ